MIFGVVGIRWSLDGNWWVAVGAQKAASTDKGDLWVTRSQNFFPIKSIPSVLLRFWFQDENKMIYWSPCSSGDYAGPKYVLDLAECSRKQFSDFCSRCSAGVLACFPSSTKQVRLLLRVNRTVRTRKHNHLEYQRSSDRPRFFRHFPLLGWLQSCSFTNYILDWLFCRIIFLKDCVSRLFRQTREKCFLRLTDLNSSPSPRRRRFGYRIYSNETFSQFIARSAGTGPSHAKLPHKSPKSLGTMLEDLDFRRWFEIPNETWLPLQ